MCRRGGGNNWGADTTKTVVCRRETIEFRAAGVSGLSFTIEKYSKMYTDIASRISAWYTHTNTGFYVGQRWKSTGRHHPRTPDRSPLPPPHLHSGPVLPAQRRGRGIAWLRLWLRGWLMTAPPPLRPQHNQHYQLNTFRQLRRQLAQSLPCRNTERVPSTTTRLYPSYHQHRVQPGQGLSRQPEKREVPPRARHQAFLRGSPMRRQPTTSPPDSLSWKFASRKARPQPRQGSDLLLCKYPLKQNFV